MALARSSFPIAGESVPSLAGTSQGIVDSCMIKAPMDEIIKQLEMVMRYHQETKHHFNRYARALGHLDWANQPNPFRRYEGATLVHLPLLGLDEEPLAPPYEDLYRPVAVPSAPVTIRTLSRLFEYALALSAWKRSEEHTSELQSLAYLVCRLLLEKKKKEQTKSLTET